ncbi:glycosyltransferase [Fictibacillus phosphorivorans]|uniref:glycosyltransferase n=1 Tax=Fictibacillus phosphorivorans TaxID=1221500 RepID=UPI003CE6AEDD
MNIVLAAEGSNGDLLPLLALGNYLREENHQITICAPPNNKKFVEEKGFKFFPLGVDFQSLLNEHSDKVMGKNPMLAMKTIVNLLREQVDRHFTELLEATKHADLLIASGVMYAAKSVAEFYNISYKHVVPIPHVIPSSEYPPLLVPTLGLPKWINKMLWKGDRFFQNKVILQTLNKHREKLRLKKIKDVRFHMLDEVIIPSDPILEKVPDDVTYKYLQTAYWHFKEEEKLDPEILNFINQGSPPVFIGFGSSTDSQPKKTASLLNELLESSKERFIISKGWANLGAEINNPRVKVIDFVPYLEIFPKMSVVIHHGGSGTTHCAARSGVPQIIVPHAMDQYHWGETVRKLHLGPEPIQRAKLTSKKLLDSIQECLSNETIKSASSDLGLRLSQKDGLKEFGNHFSLHYTEVHHPSIEKLVTRV